jgi:hypothetical protein
MSNSIAIGVAYQDQDITGGSLNMIRLLIIRLLAQQPLTLALLLVLL